LRVAVVIEMEGQQTKRPVSHKQVRHVIFKLSDYFKREAEISRPFHGTAKCKNEKQMLLIFDSRFPTQENIPLIFENICILIAG
jgi:hypothetical protein